MNLEQKKTFLREVWFPATIDSDLEKIGAMITDDCQMWMPISICEWIGKPRPVQGRAGMLEIFSHGAGEFFDCPTRTWSFRSLVAEGEYIAVNCTMTAKTAIGDNYVNDYHFLFRFDGDLISEFWEFNDTAYVDTRLKDIRAKLVKK